MGSATESTCCLTSLLSITRAYEVVPPIAVAAGGDAIRERDSLVCLPPPRLETDLSQPSLFRGPLAGPWRRCRNQISPTLPSIVPVRRRKRSYRWDRFPQARGDLCRSRDPVCRQ